MNLDAAVHAQNLVASFWIICLRYKLVVTDFRISSTFNLMEI